MTRLFNEVMDKAPNAIFEMIADYRENEEYCGAVADSAYDEAEEFDEMVDYEHIDMMTMNTIMDMDNTVDSMTKFHPHFAFVI